MPDLSDTIIDDIELNSPGSGANERKPLRGVSWLFGFAVAVSLGVGLAFSLVERLDQDSDFLMLLAPILLFMPPLFMMGFGFVMPLLWFQTIAQRTAFALLVPLVLWVSLLGGLAPFSEFGMDAESYLMGTSVLLMGCVGGAAPVALVMWMFRWRLCISGSERMPEPIGIIDLMAVTGFGAAIFAYQRLWGPFAEENFDLRIAITILAFYGLLGTIVCATLLMSMRMLLGADRRPFTLPNMIGVAITVGLVLAAWAIVVYSDDGISGTFMSPTALWLTISSVTWAWAAVVTFAVCWWLNRYGFRINTAAIVKMKNVG